MWYDDVKVVRGDHAIQDRVNKDAHVIRGKFL